MKERRQKTQPEFHSYRFGTLPPCKDYPFPIALSSGDETLAGMLEREGYLFVFDFMNDVAIDEGDVDEMILTYKLRPNMRPDDQENTEILLSIYNELRNAPTTKEEPTE